MSPPQEILASICVDNPIAIRYAKSGCRYPCGNSNWVMRDYKFDCAEQAILHHLFQNGIICLDL